MDFLNTALGGIFSNRMDFQGQELSHNMHMYLIWSAAAVGVFLGMYTQRFYYTFLFVVFGSVLAFVVCVPSWPMYLRHPIQWHPPIHPKEEIEMEETKNRKNENGENEEENTQNNKEENPHKTSQNEDSIEMTKMNIKQQ